MAGAEEWYGDHRTRRGFASLAGVHNPHIIKAKSRIFILLRSHGQSSRSSRNSSVGFSTRDSGVRRTSTGVTGIHSVEIHLTLRKSHVAVRYYVWQRVGNLCKVHSISREAAFYLKIRFVVRFIHPRYFQTRREH